MHHTLLSVALAAAAAAVAVAGSALADPAASPRAPPPASPAPPGGPSRMLRLTLAVKAGAETRTHELALSDAGCGSISDKAAAYEDQIRVCSRPVAGGILLDTDWSTRAGPGEYRTRAELLLPRTGGAGELGRTGGLRLAVTVR